ncbi:MAG: 30S ribosomal protein S17 [Patescibacteria group bacterium]|nr:30S ribosomal protein S17 [Patescibacteria group bacterium]
MTTKQPKRVRQFHGRVVSAKTLQTLVVEVARMTAHPKYHKIYATHQRFHVHDPLKKFHAGDEVEFVACRPISRTKRWRVVYPRA